MGDDFFDIDEFVIDPEELNNVAEGEVFDTGQAPDFYSTGVPQDIFSTKD